MSIPPHDEDFKGQVMSEEEIENCSKIEILDISGKKSIGIIDDDPEHFKNYHRFSSKLSIDVKSTPGFATVKGTFYLILKIILHDDNQFPMEYTIKFPPILEQYVKNGIAICTSKMDVIFIANVTQQTIERLQKFAETGRFTIKWLDSIFGEKHKDLDRLLVQEYVVNLKKTSFFKWISNNFFEKGGKS